MSLSFLYKTLSEFSFFFAFGNYFAVVGGSSQIPFYAALCPVFALFGCYILRDEGKYKRFSPLMFNLIGFFFINGISAICVYLASVAYCAMLAKKRVFYQSYDTAIINFRNLSLLCLILPFLTIFSGGLTVLGDNCAPYIVSFLVTSILQTRMLRHDAVTLENKSFQIQNIIALSLIILLGILTTTPAFLTFLTVVGKFTYLKILLPILVAVGSIIVGAFWLVTKGLSFIFPNFNPTFPPPSEMEVALGLQDQEYSQITQVSPIVNYIFLGLLIIILIVAAIFILKKLTTRRKQNTDRAEFYDLRESLEMREPPKKHKFFAPRNPRENIRHYYCKFLEECKKRGVHYASSATVTEISALASSCFDPSAVAELSEIYILARYCPREPQEEVVKRAKKAYNCIKTSKKTEENP